MANYAIIRVDKRKMASVGRINQHHERLKEKYKSNPDIDTSKTYLNYHLVKPSGRYRDLCLERIAAVGAKRRKDSVVMQDGLITATPEWIRNKPPEMQIEFFNYTFNFIKKRYGQDNILSAVVHLDEATPHMHFVFVPITNKGRLSSKEVMGGPNGMKKLQDDFYEYVCEKYPEFTRGTPSRVSKRKHIPTYLFKNANELYLHYNEIYQAIQNIGMINNARKKEAALEILGKYAPEMAKLKEQLKATDDYIAGLERENRAMNKWNTELRVKNCEQEEKIAEFNLAWYDLNKKQSRLQKMVDLIPPELLKQLAEEEKRQRRLRNNNNRGDR